MAKGDHSAVSGFLLPGLTDDPELQVMLFGVFLVVTSNLGLIVLIQVSPQLHTPMYFFLSHLAFIDFCFTSFVTPNPLVNFMCVVKSIAFYSCAVQVCCFITSAVCGLYCCPSWPATAMSPSAIHYFMSSSCIGNCVQMVDSTYVYGFSMGLLQAMSTFPLSCCGSNVVNHFCCDDILLVTVACSDTKVKELLLLIIAGSSTLCSLVTVCISYAFILSTILRIHSAEGRQKAFSTCASHLTSIPVFYETVIFMYLQPKSSHSLHMDKFAPVFYVVVIPMLNPLIYSLRNQEVKTSLKKIIKKLFVHQIMKESLSKDEQT